MSEDDASASHEVKPEEEIEEIKGSGGDDQENDFGAAQALSHAEERLLAHRAQTEEFVKKWREMMVMMTFLAILIVLWQTLQVYKEGAMTKGIFLFQILSVVQSVNTAYFVLAVLAKVPRKPTLTRTALILVPQVLMYGNGQCNLMLAAKTAPPFLSNVVLKDFVVPKSAWPISLLVFTIVYGAIWFTDFQMNEAESRASLILKQRKEK